MSSVVERLGAALSICFIMIEAVWTFFSPSAQIKIYIVGLPISCSIYTTTIFAMT